MPGLRPEEAHARAVIQRHLGVPVHQFDDGSADGMYDLAIHYPNRANAAVEVTADAHGPSIAVWRHLNGHGQRWIEPGLDGGWSVAVHPGAKAQRIRDELPGILNQFEEDGVREFRIKDYRPPTRLTSQLTRLGVSQLWQSPTSFPGSIYPTLELPSERSGAMVAENGAGDATARWLGNFLCDPARADVSRKLDRSGLAERHAFVIVASFCSAPYEAVYPLLDAGTCLPEVAPDLPSAVTHAWVMSEWRAGVGFHWDPAKGWMGFDANLPEIEPTGS